MPELTAVRFEGIHRATEVLRDLRDLQAERAIDVSDAVAVYRTDEGRLLVEESVKPTSVEGATLGGLLGVMIGLSLAVPITGGASAVVASAVGTGEDSSHDAAAGGSGTAATGHRRRSPDAHGGWA